MDEANEPECADERLKTWRMVQLHCWYDEGGHERCHIQLCVTPDADFSCGVGIHVDASTLLLIPVY